ncbi:MAG: permease [Desulfobacula sp.]|nr:permease [Desulfobacula sp.]
MKYAYGELLTDIAKPFAVGILIAGMITFFFPEDLTLWANDHRFLSMLVMLIAGIPMYVCATSSTPIAAALILKGLNPGAALVFLLAGPATNAATINIVKNLFNTKALFIYLTMISLCALVFGFIVDMIYDLSGIQANAIVGQAGEIFPESIQLIAAAILTGLIIFNWVARLKRSPEHAHSH